MDDLVWLSLGDSVTALEGQLLVKKAEIKSEQRKIFGSWKITIK